MKTKYITLGACAALVCQTEMSAEAQTALSTGHVDLGIGFENGAFDLHIHDEETDTEYSPPSGSQGALLLVSAAAATTIPEDVSFRFLGSAGEPIWVLPKTQNAGLLFLGIGAEELEKGIFTGDTVTLRLNKVAGPGHFAMFDVDPFGNPLVLLNSQDGVDDADALSVPTGGHTHVNWAFTAAGDYTLEFSVSGTLTESDQRVESPAVAYSFSVIPEPDALTLAGVGGLALLLSRSRRS